LTGLGNQNAKHILAKLRPEPVGQSHATDEAIRAAIAGPISKSHAKLVSRLSSSADYRPFWLHIDGDTAGSAEEEVMKADALMRFILSGCRSLKEFAALLARISLGVFFAISGGNKLFVASQYKLMYETIVGAGIPFPHVMTYFVSSVEFACGCLLIIGLLSTLCCIAFIIDMIVAITTVQLATITKALSFIDWLDDFLYLPEVMYIIIFLWLICSGPGRFSVDHWIAVRSGLLDDR
jgi:putative oxidoreductase